MTVRSTSKKKREEERERERETVRRMGGPLDKVFGTFSLIGPAVINFVVIGTADGCEQGQS